MDKERLKYLLLRYREQSISEAEAQELLDATQYQPEDELLATVSALIEEEAAAKTVAVPDKDLQPLINNILAVDKANTTTIKNQPTIIYRLLSKQRTAVAAILIAATLAGVIFFVLPHFSSTSHTADTPNIPIGTHGTVLTLADGTRVTLDSSQNGVIAVQQGANVVLKNGTLAYQPAGSSTGEAVYNTISTPNGKKFSVTLPDGSIVWLNAASTVRYPTTFTGKERLVEITGEAYLEVAGQVNQPFKVRIKDAGEIMVLGTTFNINAYNNTAVKTTLLTGKISVSASQKTNETNQVILQPGEQALIQPGGKIMHKKQVNTAQVLAWRHDIFNFEDADLKEVLGEISRWYDVNIVTSGPIPEMKFGGQVSYSTPLPELLNILKAYGVNCRLEGRNLVILPTTAN